MMSYEELRAAYQQGDRVTVDYGGERRRVEVVGHKECCLRTFTPAVRVYVPGYGTVLFTEVELADFGNKPRSRAERNIFHANLDALRRGHELGAWVRHRAPLYSAQCVTCGAMVTADAHGYRGTAINSLTCAETVEIGRRIIAEMEGC